MDAVRAIRQNVPSADSLLRPVGGDRGQLASSSVQFLGRPLPRRRSAAALAQTRRGSHLVQATAEKERVKQEFDRIAADASRFLNRFAREASEAIKSIQLPKSLEELQAQMDRAREQLQEKSQTASVQVKQQTEQLKVQLREQAERASGQLSEVLQTAEQNQAQLGEDIPEPIREIVQVAMASHGRAAVTKGAVVHDFCLGIPFGAVLLTGGLLWFLLTSSLNALRFGVILGGLVLAASTASLKAWQQGRSSLPFIAAQGLAASFVFIHSAYRFFQTKAVFPTLLTAVMSLGMVAFYTNVALLDLNRPNPSLA